MKLSVAAYRAITDTTNKRLTREWQRGSHAYGSVNGGSPSSSVSLEESTDKTPEIKSTFDGPSDQVNASSGSSTIRRKSSAVLPPPPQPLSTSSQLPKSPSKPTETTPSTHAKKEVKKFMSNQRSRGTQRWMKLRTTVQLTGAVASASREKKPPLKREDSFLKRFSTRHTAELVTTDYDDVEDDEDDDLDDDSKSDVEAQKDLPQQPQSQQLRRRQRRRLRRERRWVINPDENVYFWWLSVITCCVLYNYWTLIVRQAFPELQSTPSSALWHLADGVTDFVFLLDIGVQFRTGYLEQGLMVYDSRKLARHYVHSRAFALDLLGLFPLDLLRLLFDRPSPLFRFPRFVKVYRSYDYYYMVESRTLYPNLWRVINLVHILLLLAHWFGCFYYLLSEAENFVGEWVYPNPVGDFFYLTRKYLASLYWSTLTLTTIGDLPTPETDAQYLFTIVSYLCGVFVFATIVGQVGNVITNRNANRLEFERLLDGAKLYMRHHKVPREMQRRVQRWYDYTWSRGRMHAGGDINTALGILPDKLKTELALHVNLNTLKKVTIFQECQPEFLHDLVLKMKAYIFTPGDVICRKGEVAREMFIIADGILEVISSENGKVLTTMKAGDFFGEIGILNLDGLNRRTADVRSVGYAELFSLSREDVLGAMKDYPEAQDILQSMGKKRLMEARKAASESKKEMEEKSRATVAGPDNEEAFRADKDADKTGEGEGEGNGSESESTRQKAVQMVRRLRRDAKDIKNYLKRSTSKSLSISRNSPMDEVRIEMETVNCGRPVAKRRSTVTSGESISHPEIKTSFLPSLPSSSTGEAAPPKASFLQRVLALKASNEAAFPPPPVGQSTIAVEPENKKDEKDEKAVGCNPRECVEAWGATVELIRPIENEGKELTSTESKEVNSQFDGSGPVIKSILKHFSHSESDVSDLLSLERDEKSISTPSNGEKRKLTKTVSFRDHYLKSPVKEFNCKPEDCIADLLVGIKEILQIRLDDIQDQFRSRLNALETAMKAKDEIVRHIEDKIKDLETDSQSRVQPDSINSSNDSTIWDSKQFSEGLEPDLHALTHPGYVVHPRRSWPMLPSRQKLVRQKSFDDLFHHRTGLAVDSSMSSFLMTDSSVHSSNTEIEIEKKIQDEGNDSADEGELSHKDEDDDDDEEEEVEEEEDDEVVPLHDDSQTVGRENWEIQMLAKEMLKKELVSKLSNVVEEEEEVDDEDCANRSDPSGEMWPLKETIPVGENQIIQQFVHNTLKRLEKLEKVFTQTPGLVRQRSLQERGCPKMKMGLQKQTSCDVTDATKSFVLPPTSQTSPKNIITADAVETSIQLGNETASENQAMSVLSPPTDEEDLSLIPESLYKDSESQPLIKPK